MSDTFEPKIVAFVCNWCTYTGADLAGTSRMPYASNVRIIRLPCTGRISPLFILKALEQGADGVMVSGCHPGDCHYTAGNYHARRKYTVFRELLQFIGVEPERVTFSWVSAAEGKKWADLVNEVTTTIRGLGPSPAKWGEAIQGEDGSTIVPHLTPAPPIRYEAPAAQVDAQTGAMRAKAREWLDSGRVSVVIGYGEGTIPGSVRPVFVTRPEDVDRLVWNERCRHNLAVYAAREAAASPGKVAVVVKGCDERSLIGLIQENRLKPEDVHLIGMACHGMADENGAMRERCTTCAVRTPTFAKEVIGDSTPAPATPAERPDPVAAIEVMPPAERWNFWQAQLEHCIKCYACRAACPLCSCDRCLADKTQPRWIPPQSDGPGNLAWHLVRAWHLAGRCVGCAACAESCPAGIPLQLLNQKMARVVKEAFDYEPGRDPAATPPLTAYREDDKQEFIR